MIDLTKSLLIVMTYPDGRIDHRTTVFFLDKGMPYGNIISANNNCSIVEGRNRIYRDLVLPRAGHYEWFIFMDNDNFPIKGLTDIFLEDVEEADVVGCQYETGNQGGWIYETSFHMGLVRVRGKIVPTIKPPWFMLSYNEDGTILTDCECNLFKNKLLEQGARIARRGFVGHAKESKRNPWHKSS